MHPFLHHFSRRYRCCAPCRNSGREISANDRRRIWGNR